MERMSTSLVTCADWRRLIRVEAVRVPWPTVKTVGREGVEDADCLVDFSYVIIV
jgi:hypothetical protein